MNEIVKSVFLNYAVCAFLGGVTEYLAPEKAKKTLRAIVVSVLAFSVIYPLTENIPKFEKIFDESVESESETYNALMHTANLTEKKIYSQMREILINLDINEYEIYVTVDADNEQNTVFLEKIEIEVGVDFRDKIPLIKKSVPDEYGDILKVGVKNE